MDDMRINEDQAESLIENINIHCFKRGLTDEEFVNIVDKVCALSDNLGMPLDQLPKHILQEELELELEQVRGEIEDAKLKEHQVLQHYNVTMNDLERYSRNEPLVETIKSQQNKLERQKDTLIIWKRNFQMNSLRTLDLNIHYLFQKISSKKLIRYWIDL